MFWFVFYKLSEQPPNHFLFKMAICWKLSDVKNWLILPSYTRRFSTHFYLKKLSCRKVKRSTPLKNEIIEIWVSLNVYNSKVNWNSFRVFLELLTFLCVFTQICSEKSLLVGVSLCLAFKGAIVYCYISVFERTTL